MKNIEEFLAFAHSLADRARLVMAECLSGPISFETKGDQSPVTVVDQAIERALREMIAQRYPGHGILGEEYDSEKLDAEYVWVIDPIDGTKAFITGIPVFGTLIALTRGGYPIIGIIDHPATDDRWAGAEGQQSTHNGTPISVRDCGSLGEAIVTNSSPEMLDPYESAAFERVKAATKWRVYGGSCYVYGRLAMGRIDVSVDSGLDPFDYCALDAVIRGAGGVITDWAGERLSIRSGHRVLAAGSAKLHEELIKILGGSAPSGVVWRGGAPPASITSCAYAKSPSRPGRNQAARRRRVRARPWSPGAQRPAAFRSRQGKKWSIRRGCSGTGLR